MMELDLLKAFVSVAETSSFTKAALALNRTQSAVSMQIRRLEETAGTRLFDRSGRHVALTHDGEELLGYARRMLALHDEALASLRRDRIAGVVRLGAMEDYAACVLPGILGAFGSTHPRIRIELETGLTGGMVGHVGSRYDLVLALHPEGGNGGDFVRREIPVWAAATRGVPTDDPVPLALYPPGCLFRTWAIEALEGARRRWRLAYVGSSHASVEATAAAGLGVTVVKAGTFPKTLCRLSEEDGMPALPGAEIRLHRTRSASRAVSALGDFLLERLGAHQAPPVA